jgi:hypothetical protein
MIDTIVFDHTIKPPLLTPEEARLLLDHLDNVQAATLLGDKWTCWISAKKKLIFLEVDGTKDGGQ